MGQAVAASFASGLGQGIQAGGQAALQKMIQDREAKQKFEKELNKELRVARSDISQLSNLVKADNPELAKELNMLAVQSSTFGSVKGLNDAVIATGVFNDRTLGDIGEQFGAMIPKPEFEYKEARIGDTQSYEKGNEKITEVYQLVDGKPQWVFKSTAPRFKKETVKEPPKYKAWNIGTGKEVRATEEEVENSNGNIIFGGQPTAPKDPTTKAVFNTKTGNLQWATEKQISTSAGALTPVQNWDMLLDIPEENTGDISTAQENVAEKKQALDNQSVLNDTTFAAVAAGSATIQVGDIISDPDLGQMKFNGGDPTDWSNYDLLDLE